MHNKREKKRVLHIVEAFGAGLFNFIVDLASLTADDFDVYIAYGLRDETPENIEDYFSDKVHLIRVKHFTRSISPSKDIRAFFEVKKIIKSVNPDIIHLHSSKAGIIGRFAVNCKKNKVIYNPHGYSFFMSDCSRLSSSLYLLIEKLAAKKHATTVGCSVGEYNEAKKLTKYAVNIDNGLDLDNIDSLVKGFESHSPDFKQPRICTCARINYQKRPDIFNKIAESFPDLRFIWIGDGDLSDQLKSDNIEISGWVKKDEALKIENDCDIFLLASAWEGLSISLLEAMSLKKLCIVSNCVGNRDVIKNGVNGFVCDSPDDFVKAIQKVMNMTPDEVNGICENAGRDVEENYCFKTNLKQYIELYNGGCDGKKTAKG